MVNCVGMLPLSSVLTLLRHCGLARVTIICQLISLNFYYCYVVSGITCISHSAPITFGHFGIKIEIDQIFQIFDHWMYSFIKHVFVTAVSLNIATLE